MKAAAVDVIEEIGAKLHFKRPLGLKALKSLTRLFYDDDRFFILGAVNCLAHLAAHPENDRFIFEVDERGLERLQQLLLLDDDELQLAILGFLTKYSAFSEDTSYRLAHLLPHTTVKMLFQIWHEVFQQPDLFPSL